VEASHHAPLTRIEGGSAARRHCLIVLVASLCCLLMSSAATTWALWSDEVSTPAVQLSSGTFGVTVAWASEPDLSGLYPGATRDGVVTISHSGDGSWVHAIGVEMTGGLSSQMSATIYPGAVCEGTPMTPNTLTTTPLPALSSTQACVRFAVSSTAAGSYQGTSAQAVVTVYAENRPTQI
jgi:predicted ribosomally synthesized peptide with SipW-like signal peptide